MAVTVHSLPSIVELTEDPRRAGYTTAGLNRVPAERSDAQNWAMALKLK